MNYDVLINNRFLWHFRMICSRWFAPSIIICGCTNHFKQWVRLTKTNYKIPFNEILLLSPDCFMQAITTAFYSRVVVLVWFLLCPTYEVITSNVCAGPEAYSFEGT